MKKEHQSTCFVIMPFRLREQDLSKYYNDTDHWNEVYYGLIAPAIKGVGLRVQRDDEDYSSRLISEGIWFKIEEADIILCDMSTHNPNVHLELGWALRADKKIVFIKDELTEYSFDLNQHFTFEYSSRLQPRSLKDSIISLSKMIETTLNDSNLKYSMVSKMALQKRAIDESFKGNVEMGLLNEIIKEIRFSKKDISYAEDYGLRSLEIRDRSELLSKIPGSTWRKRNGLEEIYFKSEKIFLYTSAGAQKWLDNDVSFEIETGIMKLRWRHDNFISRCQFDTNFSYFSEQDGTRWYLIATEPYVHSSFGTKSL